MRYWPFILFLSFLAALAEQKPAAPPAIFGKPSGNFFAISVADAAATSRWYQDKLGFRVAKEGSAREGKVRFVLLESDGAIVEIIQQADAKSLKQIAPEISDSYLVHGIFKMGIIVADLDRVYASVKQHGIPIAYEIMPARDIPYRSFSIRDNEGNLIQFFGK